MKYAWRTSLRSTLMSCGGAIWISRSIPAPQGWDATTRAAFTNLCVTRTAVTYGTELAEADRLALVEYLKTL